MVRELHADSTMSTARAVLVSAAQRSHRAAYRVHAPSAGQGTTALLRRMLGVIRPRLRSTRARSQRRPSIRDHVGSRPARKCLHGGAAWRSLTPGPRTGQRWLCGHGGGSAAV